MPPFLVVFDLDGTLVDSLRDIAEAMNSLLVSRGLPARGLDEYRRIVGEGARLAVQRAAAGRLGEDNAVIDALTEEYLEIHRRRGSPSSTPFEGVRELLASLGNGGPDGTARLAVLTNKPHDIAVRLVEDQFGRSVRFEAVEGVREGTARKPNPAGLLEIVERLGVDLERVVYVGDTDTDMLTGRAAGVFTVGCLWGFRDEAELVAAGADAIVSRPEELEGLLRERDRGGTRAVWRRGRGLAEEEREGTD